MKPQASGPGIVSYVIRQFFAVFISVLLVPGDARLFAQQAAEPASSAEDAAAKLPADQLDSLVAPVALYPDPLLSQTLVACTYPLEIIQLEQWLEKNKGLKDKALADAVAKQGWDASIQGMAALPDVVKRLSENIKWTSDLGNAFLAQQSDVMDAVQRMRKKAADNGSLKSSEQQKVETKVVETKTVIVVEQANPQVVYVPTYNPTVVYGPPVYAYPPIYYPPPGAVAAGMAISFGVGVAMGAMWSGGWGYHAGWGSNNTININNNNNFVRNTNVNNSNRVNQLNSGNNTWQHNPQHRGGAPYANQTTANKYGGTARGQAPRATTQNARGGFGGAGASATNRAGGGAAGGFGGGNRGGAVPSGLSSGGGDRIGNRQISGGASSRDRSAFSGASGGFGGGRAQASSQRGASSFGGRRGGGGGRRR